MDYIGYLLHYIVIGGFMDTFTIASQIYTDETFKETVSHGSNDYPFCFYMEDIMQFDFQCIDWHWHPEVEFVFMQEGSAVLLVGDRQLTLTKGQGIFINTQILHRFEASNHTQTPNIVFSPSLLASEDSLIYQKYICPVLFSSMDFQLFSPEIFWQKNVLDLLCRVFALQEETDNCQLKTVRLLLDVWEQIYHHLPQKNTPSPAGTDVHAQALLQIMMQYIHTNYRQHISLDEIAATVSISKSSVLHLFQKYLHISPVNYLIRYRLKCAARLLRTPQNTIAFIAQNTGFESAGYFCRKFKKTFHMTPGQYRQNYSSAPQYTVTKPKELPYSD